MAKADIHTPTDTEQTEMLAHCMKKEVQVIEVKLSERNLLSLLTKLYIPGSAKTIYNDDVQDGYVLKLVSEDDETHYANRHPPGRMHPDTESFVTAVRFAIEDWQAKQNIVVQFHKGVAQAQGEH